MIKLTLSLLLIICTLLILGCDQKPLYPKKIKKKPATAKTANIKQQQPASKKKSNVGIKDVADYATGTTQLKTKQYSKKRLTDSYSSRKNKLEEAVKEQK